jgi:hypothetical protein
MPALGDLTRMFTVAKTVDSRALNRAGAQPFRALIARGLYNVRPGSHDPLIAELARTGIAMCENSLLPDAFEDLTGEVDAYMGANDPSTVIQDGADEIRRYSLEKVDPTRFPQLAQWRSNPRVNALVSGAERRPVGDFDGGALIEHVLVGENAEEANPQDNTHLHIDTFFNTHKVWLYLDDVDAENGAFVFVPGSHLPDRVRLRHDYLESTGENRRSRRIGDDELKERGLEQLVVECRRNTLVVANTCGYHSRSIGTPGTSRRALHREFRSTPFTLARGSQRRAG